MTPSDERISGWNLSAYIAHNEALREADRRIQRERDRRYKVVDKSNSAALRVALDNSTKADEKAEQNLKEYKQSANEWRSTVSDLIAGQQGGSKGMRDLWGWILAAAMFGFTIVPQLTGRSGLMAPAAPPQIIYVPTMPSPSVPNK